MISRLFEIYRRVGLCYIFLTLSGLVGIIWPPPTLSEALMGRIAIYFWCGGITIGGFLCCIGRWKDLTGPKLVGLSLLMVDLLTYVVAIASDDWARASSALFIMGFVLMLGERWMYAYDVRRSRGPFIGRRTSNGPDLVAYARHRLTRSRLYRSSDDYRSNRSRNS